MGKQRQKVDPYLLKALVLPCITVAIWALLLAFKFSPLGQHIDNWVAIFITLATEAISIVITVLFVDSIIRHSEHRKKSLALKRTSESLARLANKVHSTIQHVFGLDRSFLTMLSQQPHTRAFYDRLDAEAADRPNNAEVQPLVIPEVVEREKRDYLRIFTQERVLSNLEQLLLSLNNEKWRELAKGLDGIIAEIDRVQRRVGDFIDPNSVAYIVDIEKRINRIKFQYDLIPYTIGRDPDEMLDGDGGPELRSSYIETRDIIIKMTALDMRELFQETNKLDSQVELSQD